MSNLPDRWRGKVVRIAVGGSVALGSVAGGWWTVHRLIDVGERIAERVEARLEINLQRATTGQVVVVEEPAEEEGQDLLLPPIFPVGMSNGSGVPAFPGAQGWGAITLQGCRANGIRIVRVTNLAGSGTGSFRAAIDSATVDGKLTAVQFDTFGVIHLNGEIDVGVNTADCLYIAGQTARGPVTVTGGRIRWRRKNNDHLHRYMRYRLKANMGHLIDGGEPGTGQGPQRIVWDHVDLAWTSTVNGGNSITAQGDTVGDFTISSSRVYEFDQVHPTALHIAGGVSGTQAAEDPQCFRVSMVRNFIFHFSHRGPLIRCYGLEVINDVRYNWNQGAVHSHDNTAHYDVRDSYFKFGPSTSMNNGRPFPVTTQPSLVGASTQKIHVSRILGPWDFSDAQYETDELNYWTGSPSGSGGRRITNGYNSHPNTTTIPAAQRSVYTPVASSAAGSPFGASLGALGITPEDMRLIVDSVVHHSGAVWTRTCGRGWISTRDAIHTTHDANFANGTQRFDASSINISSLSHPTHSAARAKCTDTDGDGIPDDYETAVCGSSTCLNAGQIYNGYYGWEHWANDTHPDSLWHEQQSLANGDGGFLGGGSPVPPPPFSPTYGDLRSAYLRLLVDDSVFVDDAWRHYRAPHEDSIPTFAERRGYRLIVREPEALVVTYDTFTAGTGPLDSMQVDSVCGAWAIYSSVAQCRARVRALPAPGQPGG